MHLYQYTQKIEHCSNKFDFLPLFCLEGLVPCYRVLTGVKRCRLFHILLPGMSQSYSRFVPARLSHFGPIRFFTSPAAEAQQGQRWRGAGDDRKSCRGSSQTAPGPRQAACLRWTDAAAQARALGTLQLQAMARSGGLSRPWSELVQSPPCETREQSSSPPRDSQQARESWKACHLLFGRS